MNIKLVSKSGNIISVACGLTAYCIPRKHDADYSSVEIGLWHHSDLVKDYVDGYIEPVGSLTVYGYVPVDILAKLLQE